MNDLAYRDERSLEIAHKEFNNNPKINLSEVDEWKWVKMDWLWNDIQSNPEKYTKWFIIIIDKYFESLKKWKLQ